MLFHVNESTDPAFNLALEELLFSVSEDEHFLLWRNAPSIIVGRHQNTAAEIHAPGVAKRKLPVVRRITGGGAVYHDLGNINFSFILRSAEWTTGQSAENLLAPILSFLRDQGLKSVRFTGRNDIVADGLKISGCARSILRGRTLFHGTLLFHTDLGVLAEVLNPDREKIRSKGIRSVRARVGNIRELMDSPCSTDEFLERITSGLLRRFGKSGQKDPLPPHLSLEEKAEVLAEAKYRSWEWNYGTPLAYDFENSGRFPGGSVKVSMNIAENRIRDLRFSGDFFTTLPLDGLCKALEGLPPRKEVLLEVLKTIPLESYIAGVGAEDLASLLSLSS